MSRTMGGSLCVAVALAACHSVVPTRSLAITYFVDVHGDDHNPGTREWPFATLERARDAIRGRHAAGGVSVEIAGGDYFLDRPFVLATGDSGTAAAPIVYRAAAGASVRLIGGRMIDHFAPVTDAAVLARLDPSARGRVVEVNLHALGIDDLGSPDVPGIELFMDDEAMPLARWPDEGFVTIADTTTDGVSLDDPRVSRWRDEPDLWVHGYWYWDWADGRQRVAAIDTDRRLLTLAPPRHMYGYRKGQWFYVYNALSELDRPGEWYVDRTHRILYLWPRPATAAVVSTLPHIVEVHGATHITFEGLTFDVARGDAIEILDGSDDAISHCTVRNAGAWGVRIVGGVRDGVRDTEIAGTGDGGIWLEGGDRPSLTRGDHYSLRNHIHGYSRWHRTVKPAVALVGVGQAAIGNVIHDAPNEGISFDGNDHVIEANEIYDVCTETNDAGAIYTGRDWTMRGTVVRHNILHDLTGRAGAGCKAIYLDDLASGITVESNVFARVSQAVFVGGGRDNAIRNNVFADCGVAVHVDARGLGWAAASMPETMLPRLAAMPYRDAKWRARYPALARIEAEVPAEPRGNIVEHNVSTCSTWLDVDPAARALVTSTANAEAAP